MSRDYTMSVPDPFVALVFALNLEGASIVAHTARPLFLLPGSFPTGSDCWGGQHMLCP